MMALAQDTLRDFNRDLARIPIPENRVEPVRLEVEQLAAAIEKVRSKLEFDSEPANFLASLNVSAKAIAHD